MPSTRIVGTAYILTSLIIGVGGCEDITVSLGVRAAALSADLGVARSGDSVVNDLRSRFQTREPLPPSPGLPPNAVINSPLLPASTVRSFAYLAGRLSPQRDAQSSNQPTTQLGLTAADGFIVSDDTHGMAITATLTGTSSTGAEMAQGYLIYQHGLATENADIVQLPSSTGVEDFIVFEQAPAVSHLIYNVALFGVAGLRLISNSLEFLEADGTPRLRIAPPFALDHLGGVAQLIVSVSGCSVDRNTAPPWGRPVTAPGATACVVTLTWDSSMLNYPAASVFG